MSSRQDKSDLKELPIDWEPSQYSVFCGRGRGIYNAIGNQRFRVLVGSYLQHYVDAHRQPAKSRIVKKVLNIMREICPEGAFIKFQNDRYYEVSEKVAHDKCSCTFRDLLNSRAKSASKTAQQVLQRKAEAKKNIVYRMPRQVSASDLDDGGADDDEEEESISPSVAGSFYDVDTCSAVSIEDDNDGNDADNDISLFSIFSEIDEEFGLINIIWEI